MKTILAFGNPLLDITISSKEVSQLLQKYNLNPDGQKEISKHEMVLLSNDIQGLKQFVSPGGCCQNSLRVLQWILKKKCHVSICGSVGKDPEADILRNILTSEGVHARYVEHEDFPTGKTIALVSGTSRSLVAHIGAAEIFPVHYLHSNEEFPLLFKSSDIIFIEGYFLTNRFETAKYLVELGHSTKKLLVFNLCGDYLFKIIPEEIKYLARKSNIIFGNIAEHQALKCLLNSHSFEEMASSLLEESYMNIFPKTIIITDGPNPIICFYGKEVFKLSPPKINQTEIKDTTGAGDAFIGGFLAGLSVSKDIKECIELGFYGASNILKQVGCTLPTIPSELWDVK